MLRWCRYVRIASCQSIFSNAVFVTKSSGKYKRTIFTVHSIIVLGIEFNFHLDYNNRNVRAVECIIKLFITFC